MNSINELGGYFENHYDGINSRILQAAIHLIDLLMVINSRTLMMTTKFKVFQKLAVNSRVFLTLEEIGNWTGLVGGREFKGR